MSKHRFDIARTSSHALLGMFLMVMSFTLKADVTSYWNHSNEQSTTSVDHSQWQEMLNQYLVTDTPSKVHLFNYKAVTKTDHQTLKKYLTSLSEQDPKALTKAEQKAYWINLYNALTVDLILENYPVKSITKLGESFFSFGPWDDEAITIDQQSLTLNDIEHKILRPIWKDPRIHYAVNCASFSCPNLAGTAYTAENTETLLEEGAELYVNHPRGVEEKGGEWQVSKIYKWYQEDFGGNENALYSHLIQYAAPELKARLMDAKAQKADIDYHYDWSLNEWTGN